MILLIIAVLTGIAANVPPLVEHEKNIPVGYPDSYPLVLSIKRSDLNPCPQLVLLV